MKTRRLVSVFLAAAGAALAIVPAAQAEIRSGSVDSTAGRFTHAAVTYDNSAGSVRVAVTFAPGLTAASQPVNLTFGADCATGAGTVTGQQLTIVAGVPTGAVATVGGRLIPMTATTADGGSTLVLTLTNAGLVGATPACVTGQIAGTDVVSLPLQAGAAPPAPTPTPTAPAAIAFTPKGTAAALRAKLAETFPTFGAGHGAYVACAARTIDAAAQKADCVFEFRSASDTYRTGSATIRGTTVKIGPADTLHNTMKRCGGVQKAYQYAKGLAILGRKVSASSGYCPGVTDKSGWTTWLDAQAVKKLPQLYRAPTLGGDQSAKDYPGLGRFHCTTSARRTQRVLGIHYAIRCTNSMGQGFDYGFDLAPTS